MKTTSAPMKKASIPMGIFLFMTASIPALDCCNGRLNRKLMWLACHR